MRTGFICCVEEAGLLAQRIELEEQEQSKHSVEAKLSCRHARLDVEARVQELLIGATPVLDALAAAAMQLHILLAQQPHALRAVVAAEDEDDEDVSAGRPPPAAAAAAAAACAHGDWPEKRSAACAQGESELEGTSSPYWASMTW